MRNTGNHRIIFGYLLGMRTLRLVHFEVYLLLEVPSNCKSSLSYQRITVSSTDLLLCNLIHLFACIFNGLLVVHLGLVATHRRRDKGQTNVVLVPVNIFAITQSWSKRSRKRKVVTAALKYWINLQSFSPQTVTKSFRVQKHLD